MANKVNQMANVLRQKFGVKRGDRVTIYLPLIPELAFAVLACARIGAIHSVVFGGFSADSLRDRIENSSSTLLITTDTCQRRGKTLELGKIAKEALSQGCKGLKHT